MKIAFDNLDGAGARDYTVALSTESPLKIARTHGVADHCTGVLDLNAVPLPAPVRRARVVVTNDDDATLFSGAVATTPERIFAGVGTMGAVYRLSFSAIGDVNAAHSVADGTAVTHGFGDGDGMLHIAPPSATAARELATDLTVSGEIEPAAYITEYFLGDGATSVFDLTLRPFAPTGAATLLDERFDRAAIDPRLWSVNDTGGFLRQGPAGLTMSGGNGFDGQTTLATLVPLEMGGTMTIAIDGLELGPASDGVVCGLYADSVVRTGCLAGFNVRQLSGTTIATPIVNGAETGTSLTIESGHRYTLRLRLHCPEAVRTAASYTAIVDGAPQSFGGGTVDAPLTLVFEAQDLGASSNTPATVLYTGTVASSPASCTFAPVNSVQLIGSIAGCSVRQAESTWIVTTPSGGTSTVRVSGSAGEGVDCMVSTTGRITFFTGRIPLANETIAVSYRGRQRAVARLGNSDGGAWQGKVTHPAPRTTADCEGAALAALSFAAARAATLAGTYTIVNPADDIVPGDVLAIASDTGGASGTSASPDTLRLIVRSVAIEDGHARPEVHVYRIGFANDWATSLNMRPGGALDADALVPATASPTPAPVLANLPALTVVSVTAAQLQIDAGLAPPAGGGFEVRRRDWAFGPGTDADLVLRSPVRGFSIPRSAQVERYFVRMYDGSSTPVYSRLSSAVFTNLPVG